MQDCACICHVTIDLRQLADGFAAPEPDLTWSLGPRCRILVSDLHPPSGDLWLELEGGGFVAPPWLTATELEVQANGQKLARLTIDGLVHLNLHLPAATLAKSPNLELIFLTPVCPSPMSMGLSDDARPLGFAFRRLALRLPSTQVRQERTELLFEKRSKNFC